MQQNIRPKFEVHKIEGSVTVKKCKPKKGGGFEWEEVQEPGGYMVYFPTGASLRIRDDKEMERLGFLEPAELVDMDTGDSVGRVAADSLKRLAEQKVNKKAGPLSSVKAASGE